MVTALSSLHLNSVVSSFFVCFHCCSCFFIIFAISFYLFLTLNSFFIPCKWEANALMRPCNVIKPGTSMRSKLMEGFRAFTMSLTFLPQFFEFTFIFCPASVGLPLWCLVPNLTLMLSWHWSRMEQTWNWQTKMDGIASTSLQEKVIQTS